MKTQTILDSLSEELILKIFSYLDWKDLFLIVAPVSKGFNRLANDNQLMFGFFPPENDSPHLKYDSNQNYKQKLINLSESKPLKLLQELVKNSATHLKHHEMVSDLFHALAFSKNPRIFNEGLPDTVVGALVFAMNYFRPLPSYSFSEPAFKLYPALCKSHSSQGESEIGKKAEIILHQVFPKELTESDQMLYLEHLKNFVEKYFQTNSQEDLRLYQINFMISKKRTRIKFKNFIPR